MRCVGIRLFDSNAVNVLLPPCAKVTLPEPAWLPPKCKQQPNKALVIGRGELWVQAAGDVLVQVNRCLCAF